MISNNKKYSPFPITYGSPDYVNPYGTAIAPTPNVNYYVDELISDYVIPLVKEINFLLGNIQFCGNLKSVLTAVKVNTIFVRNNFLEIIPSLKDLAEFRAYNPTAPKCAADVYEDFYIEAFVIAAFPNVEDTYQIISYEMAQFILKRKICHHLRRYSKANGINQTFDLDKKIIAANELAKSQNQRESPTQPKPTSINPATTANHAPTVVNDGSHDAQRIWAENVRREREELARLRSQLPAVQPAIAVPTQTQVNQPSGFDNSLLENSKYEVGDEFSSNQARGLFPDRPNHTKVCELLQPYLDAGVLQDVNPKAAPTKKVFKRIK